MSNEMTAEEAAERLRLISKFSKNNMPKSDRKAIDFATALCRKLASGELREVVHGQWKALGTKDDDGWETYICSECGKPTLDEKTPYCKWCSAIMDGGEKHE